MIETISPSNTDVLNKFFSNEELKFIDNINIANKQLNTIYTKEKEYNVTLSDFIINLKKAIQTTQTEKNEQSLLLDKSSNVLNDIQKNLSIIEELQVISTEISNKLTNILLKNEKENNSLKYNYSELENFKKDIILYSVQNEQIKTKLTEKHTEIETFFTEEIVLTYIKKFETASNQNQPQEKNTVHEHVAIHNLKTTNINELQDNPTLIISEKKEKVFLPYKKSEIISYMEQYPNSYNTHTDVIKKEFILPLDYYMKHPTMARFRETYSLIRDRESKSIAEALKFALDLMFRYELNPAIIAACKREIHLENYLKNLEKNTLNEFKDFEIKFNVSLKK